MVHHLTHVICMCMYMFTCTRTHTHTNMHSALEESMTLPSNMSTACHTYFIYKIYIICTYSEEHINTQISSSKKFSWTRWSLLSLLLSLHLQNGYKINTLKHKSQAHYECSLGYYGFDEQKCLSSFQQCLPQIYTPNTISHTRGAQYNLSLFSCSKEQFGD